MVMAFWHREQEGDICHCHDLAKQLSYYLFIYFSFSFILDSLYKRECGKVSCHKYHKCHSHMTGSHSITSHDITQWVT